VTTVIKIGGRVQSDPALAPAVAAAAASTRLVVVHGGGDEVSALQRRLGHEPQFVGGRRTTTPEELEIVRMVLSGTANKRLAAALLSAGAKAVGVSGEDGGLLTAYVAEGAPLGRVGSRVDANAALLVDLLAGGWLPVVSPLARDGADPAGSGLNVNGDDAAAAIAAGITAEELILVADVPGVLRDKMVIPQIGLDDIDALISSGIAAGGMAAKLDAARAAIKRGVPRVRIADLTALRDRTSGTAILPSPVVAPWPQ
jgi:acetylglutamate kinase